MDAIQALKELVKLWRRLKKLSVLARHLASCMSQTRSHFKCSPTPRESEFTNTGRYVYPYAGTQMDSVVSSWESSRVSTTHFVVLKDSQIGIDMT